MLGRYAEYSQPCLLALATFTTVAFALPMVFSPLGWARVMRFEIPSHTDLAVYYGRCLGSLALVVSAMAFRAGASGVGIAFVFELSLAFSVLMVVVHVYGAVRRIQPITETLETALWVLLVIVYVLFFPVRATS